MTAREWLRPCQPDDLSGIYRVCTQTDATGTGPARFHDGELAGHVYAGPYLMADPDLAFVVVDKAGIAGYIVATADTRKFAGWLETQWWPPLRQRHPRGPDPGDGTRDHGLIEAIHAGSGPHQPWHDSHPAHLHIKLAGRLQGKGWGRRLMYAEFAALRERGVPGLHLGVAEANNRAIAFYTALGFTEAHRHDWGRTLVRSLADQASPTSHGKEETHSPGT
jgi:ribosomal protein S18 acetylase RimI-like enzyme